MPSPVASPFGTINQNYPPSIGAAIVGLNLQYGTATLSSGTQTVTGVTLTSSSVIICTYKTPAGTNGAKLAAPSTSRNTSTGQFVVNATDSAGSTVTTDTSTFDYIVIG